MLDSGYRLQKLLRELLDSWGSAIALAGLSLLATAAPATSADEVVISYGFFERTVSIAELEAFAQGAGLSHQLSEYAKNLRLTEQELATIQQVLTQQADFNAVDVAQFLYTVQGESLLEVMGDVIQTPTRLSGSKAIRAGLILAAADEAEGLSILNFLKKYPTPAIRIDLGRGLRVAQAITETLGESQRAIALVQRLANADAVQSIEALQTTQQLVYQLPDYEVTSRSLNLPFRGVQATLFLPRPRLATQSLPERVPVIVISHGLGDERESYTYLATYLAQRGFAVATLDHPGSNSDQIAQLLAGLSSDVIDTREFINRPEDITELINAIQNFALESAEWRSRLDTQNVGLIGQSFGGYTALALAGATYDTEALSATCAPQPIYLNPSLLLQCQAEELALEPLALKDDRIQAILVVNPVGSGIFGRSGFAQLEIPVMIMAATADTVAPALPEQIEPFTWLQTEDRFLVLASGTTHFSVIDFDPESTPLIPVPATLLGGSPDIAQEYLQTLSDAFFQRYLQEDERYSLALTSGFVNEFVARSPLEPLSLIRTLDPTALERAINQNELVGDR